MSKTTCKNGRLDNLWVLTSSTLKSTLRVRFIGGWKNEWIENGWDVDIKYFSFPSCVFGWDMEKLKSGKLFCLVKEKNK